uniref:Uncharacterized protein n=1 Tax=Lotus japonicus TaxID=34305 RepID=I3SRE6_LOTJA|nr:unknown [Lotus japonicus]
MNYIQADNNRPRVLHKGKEIKQIELKHLLSNLYTGSTRILH